MANELIAGIIALAVSFLYNLINDRAYVFIHKKQIKVERKNKRLSDLNVQIFNIKKEDIEQNSIVYEIAQKDGDFTTSNGEKEDDIKCERQKIGVLKQELLDRIEESGSFLMIINNSQSNIKMQSVLLKNGMDVLCEIMLEPKCKKYIHCSDSLEVDTVNISDSEYDHIFRNEGGKYKYANK